MLKQLLIYLSVAYWLLPYRRNCCTALGSWVGEELCIFRDAFLPSNTGSKYNVKEENWSQVYRLNLEILSIDGCCNKWDKCCLQVNRNLFGPLGWFFVRPKITPKMESWLFDVCVLVYRSHSFLLAFWCLACCIKSSARCSPIDSLWGRTYVL